LVRRYSRFHWKRGLGVNQTSSEITRGPYGKEGSLQKRKSKGKKGGGENQKGKTAEVKRVVGTGED